MGGSASALAAAASALVVSDVSLFGSGAPLDANNPGDRLAGCKRLPSTATKAERVAAHHAKMARKGYRR